MIVKNDDVNLVDDTFMYEVRKHNQTENSWVRKL